jgi:hypothetical protein
VNSIQIATGLLSLAAAITFAAGARHLRNLRYPAQATYAQFHTDDVTLRTSPPPDRA